MTGYAPRGPFLPWLLFDRGRPPWCPAGSPAVMQRDAWGLPRYVSVLAYEEAERIDKVLRETTAWLTALTSNVRQTMRAAGEAVTRAMATSGLAMLSEAEPEPAAADTPDDTSDDTASQPVEEPDTSSTEHLPTTDTIARSERF